MTATTTAPSTTRHADQADRWTVRYTWRVPEGSNHPGTTKTNHGSETAAIDAAVTVLDNQTTDSSRPRIVRAEVAGPGRDRYTVDWRP